MKAQNLPEKQNNSTTIQVKKDLKDQLDLLKLIQSKPDLNALISEMAAFYIKNKKIELDPKIEKLFLMMKK
jgi:hypothetical protein